MDLKLIAYLIILASLLAGVGFQVVDVRNSWIAKDRGNTVRLALGLVLFVGAAVYWLGRWPE